jgi:hypothetical protein
LLVPILNCIAPRFADVRKFAINVLDGLDSTSDNSSLGILNTSSTGLLDSPPTGVVPVSGAQVLTLAGSSSLGLACSNPDSVTVNSISCLSLERSNTVSDGRISDGSMSVDRNGDGGVLSNANGSTDNTQPHFSASLLPSCHGPHGGTGSNSNISNTDNNASTSNNSFEISSTDVGKGEEGSDGWGGVGGMMGAPGVRRGGGRRGGGGSFW